MTSVSTAPSGVDHLGGTVARFDTWSDSVLDQLRGHRSVDLVMLSASTAGDWSLIWHGIALARAIVLRRPREFIRFAVLIGAESLIVNQGVKRVFRRERPTENGDPTLRVRQPSTSSFPSGHASAATVAAAAFTAKSPRFAPLWWALAGVVGLSRVHVRIHHMSDIVGGIATGAVLWRLIGRRILR